MSPMPSVGSGTYSPGPNMVCSPEQEKVGAGSIEAIIYPVYSDLRIRATVSKFMPFNQFTPSLIERIGRKGVLEATIETPYGVMQVFNIHLHVGKSFLAHSIRVKQLKSVLELMKLQKN